MCDGAGVADRGHLRASDVDREQIVECLRRAADEGRLSADEFDERMGRTLRARTYGELDAIVADLPQEPKPSKCPRRAHAMMRGPGPLARAGGVGAGLFRQRGRVLVAGALAAVAVAVPLSASSGVLSGGRSSRCWWYTDPTSAIGKSPSQLAGMCANDQPPHGRPRADSLR